MRASTSPASSIFRYVRAISSRKSGLIAFVIGLAAISTVMAGQWQPLARDGVHDPRSPAIKQLQQPRDALSKLTPDTPGRRWRRGRSRRVRSCIPRRKSGSSTATSFSTSTAVCRPCAFLIASIRSGSIAITVMTASSRCVQAKQKYRCSSSCKGSNAGFAMVRWLFR